MRSIDVGKDFYHRLANRDQYQGDGSHNAVAFREKYLRELDNEGAWIGKLQPFIQFDFANIRKIGPSFANEAFAYFTKYATPNMVRERILFTNIDRVDQLIIEKELEAGYNAT